MASTADSIASVPGAALRPRALAREEAFFIRMATGLALFIVFGFAQFQARGMVDIGRFPWVVHAHAAAMLGWLALSVAQPRLAGRHARSWHRRLGWAGAGLLPAIVVFASLTGIAAVRYDFVPPFFTAAYFLALIHVSVLAFAGMVAWAISLRRRSDWHRRLMIGSTVLLMEPALGRLLPMPLLGGWGEWLAMALQLAALGFLVGHDRRTLGRVHPATLAGAAAVVGTHVAVELAAMAPPVVALAAGIAAA